MNNKYMGVMTAPSPRIVAAPHQQMISQQHLGMLQTSYITRAEKKQQENWVYFNEKELVDIKRNAGELKHGMKEVGSTSFKIEQGSTFQNGLDLKKYQELRTMAKDANTQEALMKYGDRFIQNQETIRVFKCD